MRCHPSTGAVNHCAGQLVQVRSRTEDVIRQCLTSLPTFSLKFECVFQISTRPPTCILHIRCVANISVLHYGKRHQLSIRAPVLRCCAQPHQTIPVHLRLVSVHL